MMTGISLLKWKLYWTNMCARFHFTGRCAGCAAASQTTEELINRELAAHVPGIKKAVLANGISPELLEQTMALLREHPSF